MRRVSALLLLIVLIGSVPPAYAKDSECDCKKGGLGLMLAGFVAGFGVRTFNTVYGCDNSVGVGLGSEKHQVRLGAGYSEGVFSGLYLPRP